MTKKNLPEHKHKERPKNDFVHCTCGATYISGYTHCPKCGLKNPMDKEQKDGNR